MQRHTNRYAAFLILSVLFVVTSQLSFAQTKDTVSKTKDTISFSSAFNFSPYDTIIVPAHPIDGDTLAARYYSTIWVVKPMPPAMRKRIEEWTRLRNAVYVTYPYAKKAGAIMNDMNVKLAKMNSEDEKKTYIKSREKELKKEFADPLTNLSVYQGKILMKLINRQTGNNCYDIIKEYKGGFTARFWQTVAFFFGSSLKQPYDAKGDDQQIERIVQEMERMYRG